MALDRAGKRYGKQVVNTGEAASAAAFKEPYGAVEVGEGVRIGSDVAIVPPVVPGGVPATTVIGPGALIGSRSVIAAGITVGRQARIEIGAVVETSVPDFAIVKGNPATIIGYTYTPRTATSAPQTDAAVDQVGVGQVTLHRMMTAVDMRGRLTVGEFEQSVPFRPRRYFLVYDVPSKDTRGEHAHRECHQFLICVHGSVTCVVDDGVARREIVLSEPRTGLYMPPMIWGTQYQYAPGSVLLVFASHHYDAVDYIRDYGQFLSEISGNTGS